MNDISHTEIIYTGDTDGKEIWKVRQPLWAAVIGEKFRDEMVEIVKDELNVKNVFYHKDAKSPIIMPNPTTGWNDGWVMFMCDGVQVDLEKQRKEME